MNEIPISYKVGEDTVAGTVHVCEGARRGAVLLQGWGGTRYGPQRILVQASRSLAAAGRTCLRIDFRGRGDSTGDPTAASLDGMIEDVSGGLGWLEAEYGIEQFTFLGLCAGANVAIGAASLVPEKADRVVAWSILPFMEHKQQAHGKRNRGKAALLKHYARKSLDLQQWKRLLKGEANVKGAMATLQKDKEGDDEEKQRKTSRRDILKDFEAFQGKCLMVFGTRDVEASDSCGFFQDWMKRHHVPTQTYWVKGAPHNFYTAAWTREVIARTVDWLEEDEE